MKHHALKTVQCCTSIKNCHRGRYVLGMSKAVFMQRNTYFYAMQVRKPRVHFCIQEWGTGHRRTFTDSGGVTCTLGKRTVGQAAGPESEWWEPGWGQGGYRMHGWKSFRGRAMRIPGVRGGGALGRDAICKPGGAAQGCYTARPGPGLFTLSL